MRGGAFLTACFHTSHSFPPLSLPVWSWTIVRERKPSNRPGRFLTPACLQYPFDQRGFYHLPCRQSNGNGEAFLIACLNRLTSTHWRFHFPIAYMVKEKEALRRPMNANDEINSTGDMPLISSRYENRAS